MVVLDQQQSKEKIDKSLDKALLELKRLICDESYQKYIKRVENRNILYKKLKALGRR